MIRLLICILSLQASVFAMPWGEVFDHYKELISDDSVLLAQYQAFSQSQAPAIVDPRIKEIAIVENSEELVDIRLMNCTRISKMLQPTSPFEGPSFNSGLPNASKMRASVFLSLQKMIDQLDKIANDFGYKPGQIDILVFEGLRDLSVQKMLFDKKLEEIVLLNPEMTLEAAEKEASRWISPVKNNTPVHSTGAAVDLRLWDNQQNCFLDLGPFGVIWGDSELAPTFSESTTDIQKNNRLFCLIAAERAGLTNYVYEWWHFSYGDRYAVYWNQNQETAIYGSVQLVEVVPLDIIPYDLFKENDSETIDQLVKALHEKGIVGIRGVPNYIQSVHKFINASRAFCSLSDVIKESYAPNRNLGEMFLGYEKGKEKFKTSDGKWKTDDLKISYYGYVPENPLNKWPLEVNLKSAFQELGGLMAETGQKVMEKINLIGSSNGIYLDDVPKVGRMLCYQKNADTNTDNPFWCGAHFDHGMFTAIIPATYFVDGKQIPEPEEAGLFVKIDGAFKKILSDPEVMMFQVGEFGQLVSHDAIKATQHRVHKAYCSQVERYAMALFFDAPMNTTINSYSELTSDTRYGGGAGDPCTYQHWNEESFKRYLAD